MKELKIEKFGRWKIETIKITENYYDIKLTNIDTNEQHIIDGVTIKNKKELMNRVVYQIKKLEDYDVNAEYEVIKKFTALNRDTNHIETFNVGDRGITDVSFIYEDSPNDKVNFYWHYRGYNKGHLSEGLGYETTLQIFFTCLRKV